MKKLLYSLTILVGFSTCSSAEQLKTVFNPFTGKLDYITRIDTNTIVPGGGIAVTCVNGACTVAASGSAASNLETIFGTERTSPTATLRGRVGDFLGNVSGSTMTIVLNPFTTNYIWNSGVGQSGAVMSIPAFNATSSSVTVTGHTLLANSILASSAVFSNSIPSISIQADTDGNAITAQFSNASVGSNALALYVFKTSGVDAPAAKFSVSAATAIYSEASTSGTALRLYSGTGNAIQVEQGSVTLNNLSASQFVKTNASKSLVSSGISGIDLPGDATSYIHNQTTAQTATFYVSSGTIDTQFNLPYLSTGQVVFVSSSSKALSGSANIKWDNTNTCLTLRGDCGSQTALTINADTFPGNAYGMTVFPLASNIGYLTDGRGANQIYNSIQNNSGAASFNHGLTAAGNAFVSATNPITYSVNGNQAFHLTSTSATLTGTDGLLVMSTVTIQPSAASNNILVASVTLPSSLAAATQGVFIDVIGAGSSNVNVGALRVNLDPGFSGNGTATQNAAIFATNASSIAATITNRTSAGIVGQATGLGTGTQVGVIGNSAQASGTNIGMNGKAINATNSPVTNMGVYGMAGNGVTNNIAGYFMLRTDHSIPSTLGNSALIADNGAIASNIFEARDNGTSQFTIADGGGVTISSTVAFNGTVNFSTGVLLSGAAGTSGQVFTSGGTGAVPTWTTVSASGGGYALEPATVTIQANKGITASTGTFYTTTASTEAFIIKDTAGNSAFRFDSTTLVSTDTIFTVIGSTNASGVVGFSTSTFGPFALSVSSTNHVNTKTPSPVLSSCGSSPSVLGSDFAFTITGGATSNGCTATFAIPFVAVPTCSVSQQSMSLVNALSYTVSATAVTITQTGLGTGKIDVVCIGHD